MPLQDRLGTSSRARCSPRQVPDRREAPNPRLAAGRPRSLVGARGWKGRRRAGAGPGPGTAPIAAPAAGRGRGWTAAPASAVCTGVRCPSGKPLAGPWRGRTSRLSAGTAPRGARGPCTRPPRNAGTTWTAPGRAARRVGLSDRERLSPRSAAESLRAAPPPGALFPPSLDGCQPVAPFPRPPARGCPTAGPTAVEPQARVPNRLVAGLEGFHANVHFLFLGLSYPLVFLYYTLGFKIL